MHFLKSRWLLICLLAAQILSAQNIDSKLAGALQQTLDSMHQILNINGLGAAIQLPNNAVWAGGSGISTFIPLDSVGTGHHFATGSSTKTVTAACIMQLVDEEILTLDDSLHLWLPPFQHIDSSITIRQLLKHQSGVRDVFLDPTFQPTLLQNPNQLWEYEDVISTFIQAPVFQPGTQWGYSNTNYVLLAMIIEAATGNSYHQEINNRFFDPMGLESIVNLAYDPQPDSVAHLWLDITGDGVVDDAHLFFTGWHSMFSSIGPAGGYFAQPRDMAIWMRACMSGSLFSEQIWEEAIETVNTGLPGGSKYGLGLMERNYLGWKSYGHGGDISYSTSVVYFPEKDISIAVQANDARINSWNLANTVAALLATYIECEAIISQTEEKKMPMVNVTISPNPFIDNINIKLDTPDLINDLEIYLTDIYGNIFWSHFQKKLLASNNLYQCKSLGKIPAGNYFTTIYANGKLVHSSQVIKGSSNN